IERGITDRIEPYPWQTDTCIGDWHYRRSLFEQHRYKTPQTVIHMLADIVSKNGNLLLNIPVRGDGTIDADEVAFLREMAAWMKSENGLSITLPAQKPCDHAFAFKIRGTGLVQAPGG